MCGWKVVTVEELAHDNGLLGEFDIEEQAKEIDIDKLRHVLGPIEGPLIIDGHLSHHLQVDAIVILRCEPSILRKRLHERGYPEWKIESNVEWEIIGSSWPEIENGNISEFETTFAEEDLVWSRIEEWIEAGYPSIVPTVDWMED